MSYPYTREAVGEPFTLGRNEFLTGIGGRKREVVGGAKWEVARAARWEVVGRVKKGGGARKSKRSPIQHRNVSGHGAAERDLFSANAKKKNARQQNHATPT